MKKSNTGLFIILGFVAVLIAVTIIGARVIIGNVFEMTGLRGDHSARVETSEVDFSTVTYDYADFDKLHVNGAWTINIKQGETYKVTIKCPKDLKDLVSVKLRGNRLYFEDIFRFTRLQTGTIKADVTMPFLEAVEVDGAASMYVYDFKQDRLELEINGAANLLGEKNSFNTVELKVNGAGNVDLGKSETTNADIDIDGVGNVTIAISGGYLDGVIDGLGKIKYYGEISDNRIDIRGLGNVKKLE